MDARGFVRITGRVKEMIIRGGENLFPAEIENVLLEHPDVAEVAVVGVPDAKYRRGGRRFRPARRRRELRSGRAQGPLPRANRRAESPEPLDRSVSEWPLTGSGKIQKFELRDQWLATQAVAPQD